MASMASLDFAHPSSVDSDHPMSRLSSRSASSISLISSVVSSDLDDYYSCAEEMAADQRLLHGSREELDLSSDAEADQQPSTVFIHSIGTSPVATPDLSHCPLSPLPLILPSTADCATQSDEHNFSCPCEWATLVVWGPRLSGTFPPDSNTYILPPWWRGEECHGTFGYPAFTGLPKPASFAGRFAQGDPRSDDMEGRPVWNPSVPETLRQRAR